MSVQPRFCISCGSELLDAAQFCTGCGQEVAVQPTADPAPAQVAAPASAPAVAPAPPPAATPEPVVAPAAAPAAAGSEHVVSMISNAMLRAGFMGVKTKPYVLVFTPQRIIFARVTNDMLKQAVADARDGAKSEGKGFFGQWGAQLTAYTDLANRYLETPPEQILHENPDNFAVALSEVTKAKFKMGTTDENGADTSDRLILKTTGKTYTIVLNGTIASAKQALSAVGLI